MPKKPKKAASEKNTKQKIEAGISVILSLQKIQNRDLGNTLNSLAELNFRSKDIDQEFLLSQVRIITKFIVDYLKTTKIGVPKKILDWSQHAFFKTIIDMKHPLLNEYVLLLKLNFYYIYCISENNSKEVAPYLPNEIQYLIQVQNHEIKKLNHEDTDYYNNFIQKDIYQIFSDAMENIEHVRFTDSILNDIEKLFEPLVNLPSSKNECTAIQLKIIKKIRFLKFIICHYYGDIKLSDKQHEFLNKLNSFEATIEKQGQIEELKIVHDDESETNDNIDAAIKFLREKYQTKNKSEIIKMMMIMTLRESIEKFLLANIPSLINIIEVNFDKANQTRKKIETDQLAKNLIDEIVNLKVQDQGQEKNLDQKQEIQDKEQEDQEPELEYEKEAHDQDNLLKLEFPKENVGSKEEITSKKEVLLEQENIEKPYHECTLMVNQDEEAGQLIKVIAQYLKMIESTIPESKIMLKGSFVQALILHKVFKILDVQSFKNFFNDIDVELVVKFSLPDIDIVKFLKEIDEKLQTLPKSNNINTQLIDGKKRKSLLVSVNQKQCSLIFDITITPVSDEVDACISSFLKDNKLKSIYNVLSFITEESRILLCYSYDFQETMTKHTVEDKLEFEVVEDVSVVSDDPSILLRLAMFLSKIKRSLDNFGPNTERCFTHELPKLIPSALQRGDNYYLKKSQWRTQMEKAVKSEKLIAGFIEGLEKLGNDSKNRSIIDYFIPDWTQYPQETKIKFLEKLKEFKVDSLESFFALYVGLLFWSNQTLKHNNNCELANRIVIAVMNQYHIVQTKINLADIYSRLIFKTHFLKWCSENGIHSLGCIDLETQQNDERIAEDVYKSLKPIASTAFQTRYNYFPVVTQPEQVETENSQTANINASSDHFALPF